MHQLETIDHKEKLYVYRVNKGYGTIGFSYAAREARAAAELTGHKYNYAQIEAGTEAGFNEYQLALEQGREANARTGRRAEGALTKQLIGLEGKRVEVVDSYGETRRFIVGKSTGWMPIHLEIHNRSSSGGMGAHGTPYKSVRVIPGGRR
jgi:hypothetical protein